MGRHDCHALGVQAAALDVGAVDAQQGGRTGTKHTADRLGLPAHDVEGAVKPVVVVPDQPVDALVDAAVPLLAVDDNTPLGPITRWSMLAGEPGTARSCKTT
jgi:hypothetical protein